MILLELTQVLPASAMPSPHWSWELVADFAGALRAGLPCSFLRPVVWDPFPCWLGTGESFPGQRSDVPCLKAQGDWARCSMVFVGCWLLLVPSPLFLSEAPPPHWFWLWLWATPCASMFRGTGPRTGSSLPVTWGPGVVHVTGPPCIQCPCGQQPCSPPPTGPADLPVSCVLAASCCLRSGELALKACLLCQPFVTGYLPSHSY
jgi:hypothetical protein